MSTRCRKDVAAQEIRLAKVFKHILIKWADNKIAVVRGKHNEAYLPRWDLTDSGWVLKSLKPAGEAIGVKKGDFRSICQYTVRKWITNSVS